MPRLDPHKTAGVILSIMSAAIVTTILMTALGYGARSCPADTGLVPATLLDGRTVCVVPAR